MTYENDLRLVAKIETPPQGKTYELLLETFSMKKTE